MKPTHRRALSRTHRRLGLVTLVPLAGWIVSSFVLHGVVVALPNGLQGVYDLAPYYAEDVPLEAGELLGPSDVLEIAAQDGLHRVYWLRLEQIAGSAAYIVKPGPFELERVYDARSGGRLDPLPEETLRAVADEELLQTTAAALHPSDEFNRYYTVDRVPAVAAEMEGAQPSEIVLSRASGRVLRRTDPAAEIFERAYRTVHIWQWGDSVRLFTTLLYTLVGLTLILVCLGYVLWFDRRPARKRWTDQVRKARRVHARFALGAGLVLATQMLVGAYLWYNLGLIEPRFRGQGSFETAWTAGIGMGEMLPSAQQIAEWLPEDVSSDGRPVQRYEWRGVESERFFLAYPRRNGDPVLLNKTGVRIPRLTADQAAAAGAMVVAGQASGEGVEATEYWMDANERVATYRFRFSDPDDTDVHVSQMTGEVVQRRPGIWRLFGPFLVYHTFGFTGNPWLDTVLLTLMQALVLVMMVSGWRLSRGKPKTENEPPAEL